ncbi:glycosyltransferase [Benzoatithermus flavus]|uniref:Glycosyltransferase n=1 Tax=Benzoatithermus flavus TaxID=3108223 RepID=A0ABU8XWM7_9PROT
MAGRRSASRGHDFDLVLAGDFRARGEVAETLASHLAVLSGLDLELGLLWLRDPALPATAPVYSRIAALVRRHAAVPIEADSDAVSCRLLLLYEPRLVANGLDATPRVRADTVLVVLARPFLRRGGPSFDTAAAVEHIAERLGRQQVWCPTTPLIRKQYAGHAAGLVLYPEDLTPCEPIAAWRTVRPERAGRAPVLGRIIRYDDDRLPAKATTLLGAHPNEPDLEVRFLGGAKALSELVEPLPANWRLLEPDATSARRFLARLDFYVQYHDDPAWLFPRAALQAMAAGRVVVAPPSFRAVLGDGPAYRPPEQVAETVRYLHAEPRFYARYLAEQDATLAERFAPDRFLDRLGAFVKLPRLQAHPRPSPRASARRTVAFYPTNGVGLGHVTRLLAIARRLPPDCEPVFFTPCHALAVIEHAGFRTEYVPEPIYDETAHQDHVRATAPRLLTALRYYDPAGIVFDGNVPREALLQACAEFDAPTIWVRRGMWRADPALGRHLHLSRFFDAVIEPAEAAAAADTGVTAGAEDAPVVVPPVMLLDRSDLLPPAAAREALGLDAGRPAALVQLGSGNNNDIESRLDHIVEAASRLDLQLVVAEWLIQHNPVRRKGVRYLSAFPNARYFKAFDLAVSAAGYNSFHELLHHGLPCIFLPNDNQKVDDQRARAAWAESEGAGVCVPRGAESAIASYLAAFLDPSLRRSMSRRARALCPTNGAEAAAGAIANVIARG